jgi:predicted phosphodiesterase
MQLGILHLSDIHFKQERNVILNRTDKIFDAVKNSYKGCEALILIISGDIAFSGKKKEYENAKYFIRKLYPSLKQYLNIDPYALFIPGNHDCDFENVNEKIRVLALKEFSQNGFDQIDEPLINLCCEPLSNYFLFDDGLKGDFRGELLYKSKLLKIVQINVGGKKIKFNLFNTSWHSTLKERIGTLGFPIEYLNSFIPLVENDFSISVLHHPFNWQTPENSRDFRNYLLKTSDIIITGHEHNPGLSVLSDFESEFDTIHIEGGALQDSDHINNSFFNSIVIQLETNEVTIAPYNYNSSQARYIRDVETSRIVNKHKKLKTTLFQLSSKFHNILETPGASFIHSSGEDLKLSDIFISPNVSDVSYAKETKNKLLEFIAAEKVMHLKESDEQFYKVIFGQESSGKTSLLKYQYLKYYSQDLYPVLVDIGLLNDSSVDKIKRVVIKEFSKQYDELDGRYDTIDFDKIVLLIDDFHKLANKKIKPALITNLVTIFKNIIVTGNELMQFDSYTNNKSGKQFEVFDKFERYTIQEFGPALRNKMIEKWYRLGKDYLDNNERNDFFRKVDLATNSISTIIGRNLIPSHPIYILSILQALESGQTDTTNENLHSYYYELLIKTSLKKAVKDKEDIGFYLNLIKEYCYFLFDTKIRFNPIAEESFAKFLGEHNRKYNLPSIGYEKVKATLIKGKILREDIGNLKINHRYIYYYFVAQYLADNIDSEDSKSTIDLMAERIYREEYSNILMFLTYLSKNSFIVDKLIEKSRDIFREFSVMKLQDDINFINDLHQSIPAQIIEDFSIEDARLKDIKHKDEIEVHDKLAEDTIREEDYDLTEDVTALDVIAKLTKAMRTINIIGQITRRNWGEMKGESKYNLAEETFSLGLRTLSFYFNILRESQTELAEHIKSMALTYNFTPVLGCFNGG